MRKSTKSIKSDIGVQVIDISSFYQQHLECTLFCGNLRWPSSVSGLEPLSFAWKINHREENKLLWRTLAITDTTCIELFHVMSSLLKKIRRKTENRFHVGEQGYSFYGDLGEWRDIPIINSA